MVEQTCCTIKGVGVVRSFVPMNNITSLACGAIRCSSNGLCSGGDSGTGCLCFQWALGTSCETRMDGLPSWIAVTWLISVPYILICIFIAVRLAAVLYGSIESHAFLVVNHNTTGAPATPNNNFTTPAGGGNGNANTTGGMVPLPSPEPPTPLQRGNTQPLPQAAIEMSENVSATQPIIAPAAIAPAQRTLRPAATVPTAAATATANRRRRVVIRCRAIVTDWRILVLTMAFLISLGNTLAYAAPMNTLLVAIEPVVTLSLCILGGFVIIRTFVRVQARMNVTLRRRLPLYDAIGIGCFLVTFTSRVIACVLSVNASPDHLDNNNADTMSLISNISFGIFCLQVLAIAITLTIYGNGTLKFVLAAVKGIPEIQWSPAQLAARRLLRVSSALRWFIAYEILVLGVLPSLPGTSDNIPGVLILRLIQAVGLWFVLLIGSLFVPAPWRRDAHLQRRSKNGRIHVGPSPPPTTPHSVNNGSHNGAAYIRPPTANGLPVPSTPLASGMTGTAAWPSPHTGTIPIGTAHLSPANNGTRVLIATTSGGAPGIGMTTRGSSVSAIALQATPRHGSRGGSGALPATTTGTTISPMSSNTPFGGNNNTNSMMIHVHGTMGMTGGAPLSPIHSVSPPAQAVQPVHHHASGGGHAILVNDTTITL